MDNCALCGKKPPFERLRPEWMQPIEWTVLGRKVAVDPHICPDCGLAFLHPMPDENLLLDYYQSQGRTFTLSAAYAEQAEFIDPRPGGKFLDVGAYDGRLLGELSRWVHDECERFGTEPDQTVEPVIQYRNLPFLKIAEIEGLRFDLVIMSHVLEHLIRPLHQLERVRGLLVDDGCLFVEIPDLQTPYIQVVPYWTPFHLRYFTTDTLILMLLRAGFRVSRLQRTGYGATRVLAVPASASVIPSDDLRAFFDPDRTRAAAAEYQVKRAAEAIRLMNLLKCLGGRRVAIFGTGHHTRFLLNLAANMPFEGFEIVRLLSSNPEHWLKMFEGFEVLPPDPMNWADVDAVILSSYDSQDEMADIIGEKAFRLYDEVRAYDTWKGES